jgi:hypothetical protein
MQTLKQGFARGVLRQLRAQADPRQGKQLSGAGFDEEHIWQRRFYDFVVFTEKKKVEKLRYMHRNPSELLISLASPSRPCKKRKDGAP